MSDTRANKRFRSQEWFDNPNNPGMTALYIERYQNQEYTREELQAERPIIGIAQTGSDLAPCNKIQHRRLILQQGQSGELRRPRDHQNRHRHGLHDVQPRIPRDHAE